MNYSKTYHLSDIKSFETQSLIWSQQFDIVLFSSGNDFTNGFKNYLAIGKKVQPSIQPSFQNNEFQFGFITYDYKNQIEEAFHSNTSQSKFNFPEFYFFKPDILIEFVENKAIIYSSMNNVEEIFDNIQATKFEEYKIPQADFQTSISKEEYISKVTDIQAHINQGDLYLTNYCIDFNAEIPDLNAVNLFIKMLAENPVPFAGFIKFENQHLMCLSPERYIQKIDNQIITQPIKGTAPRGNNIESDLQNQHDLKNNLKEKAENVMVVDLVRNDLSHICNNVKVDELCGIYSFETVHQMISTISGTINEDIDFEDIIKSTFPMGSMTGAPKIAAVNISNLFENFARSLYSGTLGYINPDGNFDFNVVIRSILYNQTTGFASIRTGSAITTLANAEQEWNECHLKAMNLINLFK